MSRIVDDISVPKDLGDAIRRTAAAVPGYPSDLVEVRRRRAARGRRLAGGLVALVAVVVAVAVAVPFALARGARPLPGTADSSGPSAPAPGASTAAPTARPPAQRLFLSAAGFVSVPGDGHEAPNQPDPTKPNLGYPPGAWGLLGIGAKEVLPDGRVITHPLSGGAEAINNIVPLPDGRLVTLGTTDLAPGLERTDGPCVTHLGEPLAIHRPDGTAAFSRDVRIRCHMNTLVGATAEEAFLVRDGRLLAHRFSNGAERSIVSVSALGDSVDDLNIAAGRAATLHQPNSQPCTLRVLDIRTGELVRAIEIDPARAMCNSQSVRLSPDGRLAAVAYDALSDQQVWFAVVEVATGRIRLRQVIDQGGTGQPVGVPATALAGLAWTDNATLRAAWTKIPNMDRIYQVEEVLDVQTYTVP